MLLFFECSMLSNTETDDRKRTQGDSPAESPCEAVTTVGKSVRSHSVGLKLGPTLCQLSKPAGL